MGEFRPASRGGARLVGAATLVLCATLAFALGEPPQESPAPPSPHVSLADHAAFLQLVGLGPEWWRQAAESGHLPTHHATIARIVVALRKVPGGSWELWCRDATAPQGDLPRQATVAQWRGEVKRIRPYELPPAVARRFELGPLWDVVATPDGRSAASVHFITPHIPDAWSKDSPTGQTVRLHGLWLGKDKQHTDWAVGPRVVWIPQKPAPQLGITADHVRLAAAGFDCSRLDDVRKADRQPIGQTDREAFWEMLRATRRLEGPLPGTARPVESVATLLTQSAHLVGAAVRLTGNIRRITRIEVTTPLDRRRLGFDHYYQLDMFADLDDTVIRIGGQSPGKTKPRSLHGYYPVTLCLVDLPSPLAQRFAQGTIDKLHYRATVEGYLFKNWRYHSDFIAQFGDEARQVVPLVLPTRLQEWDEPPRDSRLVTTFLAAAIGGIVLVTVVTVALMRRRDRTARRRLDAMRRE